MRASALAFLLCGVPALGLAQDAPVVVLQSWKCDVAVMPQLQAFSDSVVFPYSQELVDEGKFDYVQMLVTSFGDEWNIVYYYRAKDLEAYFAAWDAWIANINENWAEEAAWWYEQCPEVKHALYRSTAYTELRTP